ncbi:MAG TPA: asparagine synthase-related protein [Bryobacteraceae bacterium]|nr:asparagine synthase-related protein [Bryobacteraceae bacterium]
MSRFIAITNLDGAPAGRRSTVRAVGDPAGPGVWSEGPGRITHHLLPSTPEAQFESSPAISRDGALVLAADVRLDNREELGRDLGCRITTLVTDADLVLLAYERWGEECAQRFLGDFAFALYDRRRKRLFCGRDQAGVRQLYYFHSERLFACASSAEALLDHPGIPAGPDAGALALSLVDRFPAPERTLYAGIRRLPPGHCLTVGRDGLRVRRYHDWASVQPARYADRAEATERFRELFEDAVRRRLRSTGPAGATLSGGLDSAAIVCMARAVEPARELRAYSLVFPTLPCDEGRYIDDAARAANVGVERFAADSNAGFLNLGEPLDYPGVPPDLTFSMTFGLLERAREQGTRVLLWGFGGDELLTSGTAYITDLVRRREYRIALQTVRERAHYYSESPLRLGFNACVRPFLPSALRHVSVARTPRPLWLRAAAPPTPRHRGRVFAGETQERLYRGLCSGRSIDYTLPGTDALGAAFSLDFRHPFFDRRLIEYGLSLPMEHSALLASKLALRDSMVGLLPESIRTRFDKTGFDAFIKRELQGRQTGIIASSIRNSELAQMGLVEPAALFRCFEDYCAGQADGSTNGIAAFVRTELWLRALQRRTRGHHDESCKRAETHGQEAVLCP